MSSRLARGVGRFVKIPGLCFGVSSAFGFSGAEEGEEGADALALAGDVGGGVAKGDANRVSGEEVEEGGGEGGCVEGEAIGGVAEEVVKGAGDVEFELAAEVNEFVACVACAVDHALDDQPGEVGVVVEEGEEGVEGFEPAGAFFGAEADLGGALGEGVEGVFHDGEEDRGLALEVVMKDRGRADPGLGGDRLDRGAVVPVPREAPLRGPEDLAHPLLAFFGACAVGAHRGARLEEGSVTGWSLGGECVRVYPRGASRARGSAGGEGSGSS